MSDDKVSKVYKILSFGICAKSNLKLKYSQIKCFICEYYFCFTLRCVRVFFYRNDFINSEELFSLRYLGAMSNAVIHPHLFSALSLYAALA